MFSLRTTAARGARSSFRAQYSRLAYTSTPRSLSTLNKHTPSPKAHARPILSSLSTRPIISSRPYSTAPTTADTLVADLQEQYATARDEFEIATEETEKKTTYAESDRQAAREELDKLKAMYEEASKGPFGDEVVRRVGGRIREIDAAVVELERRAIEDH